MKTNYEKALDLESRYVNVITSAKHAGNEEVRQILQKRLQRSVAKEVLTVREFCNELVKKRLDNLAKSLPDDGYSMGSRIVLRVNRKIAGVQDTREVYPSSCKFRATHGGYKVYITVGEYLNARNIGGLYTVFKETRQRGPVPCWWYEAKGNKQYFRLIKVHGWVYREFHSESRDDVIRLARERENRIRIIRREKERVITRVLEQGDSEIVFCHNHAKLVSAKIGNEYITLTGSMNAGANAMIETLEIFNCKKMHNFVAEQYEYLKQHFRINPRYYD